MLHRFASHLTDRRIDALVLFAGALTPLAFAPFEVFPLAMFGPALLFVSWRQANAARAAWRGFLYGVGLFGVGVSWVYVSLHTYGFMPAPLAGFAVTLFVAGLALFPASVGWVQARFAPLPAGLHLSLLLPSLWVVFEWTRGWFLTGFPWLNLGYSQTDTPLAGLAPWIGVYGMSFAVAVTAGLLAAAWIERRRAILFLPAAALLWLGAWFAGQPEWAQPAGSPIQVALVQANVPITVKWRPEQRDAIVNRYIELSAQAPQAQLIVWPEAAVPGYFDLLAPTLVPRLEPSVRNRNATFLIGAVERDVGGRGYYNSVFAVGAQRGSYRKQHLVPFGEFLPWSAVFGWLIDHLHIPMSNFARGTAGQPLLIAAGQQIGVSVCYEDAFGEEIIKTLPTAALLVNVSEDSWFGNSLAPHQRLQMARVRALESARPLLRAANTGPSAIIDHRGNVIARSPQFAARVLTAEIQPMNGATFYARYGNAPIVVFALSIVLASAIARRLGKNRRKRTQAPD